MRRLVVVLLLASACMSTREVPPAPMGLADLSEEADLAANAGNVVKARGALHIMLAPETTRNLTGGERRTVHQDVYFRLASLALDESDAGGALDAAEKGLALGRTGDLFEANLWVVKGRALEARSDVDAAAEAYAQALAINEKLLNELGIGDLPE